MGLSYECLSTSGVTQGSNLGPILFTLFVNDLPDCLPFCKVLHFADDLKLFITVTEVRHAILLPKTGNNLKELIAIEHKVLRYASTTTSHKGNVAKTNYQKKKKKN